MTNPLTTIVMSMYNAREKTIKVVDKLFFPGLINNASPDKQLVLLDDCSPAQKETEALVDKYKPDLVQRFGDVRITRNEQNLGFGASYNKGMKFADGENFLLVNSDIYLSEGSVDSLVKTLSEDDSYGLVNPVSSYQFGFQNTFLAPKVKKYSPEELKQIEEFAKWLRKVMQGKRYKFPNSRGTMSCFVVRKTPETYFDERFKFGFCEDTDLNERMLRAGYKLIVDASTYVWHYGSASTCQRKLKSAYALTINGAKLVAKWGEPLKFLGEFVVGCIQAGFDKHTVSSEIAKHAKEKGLWQEYQEKFRK